MLKVSERVNKVRMIMTLIITTGGDFLGGSEESEHSSPVTCGGALISLVFLRVFFYNLR
jgi:hypothetical protein